MRKPPTNLAAGLTMLAPMPACISAAIAGGTSGVIAAAFSLVLAGIAAARLRPRETNTQPPLPPAPISEDTLRRTRHDLRGALSPALLTTDRLLSSADPGIQRCGTIILQSIQRAITLIAELGGETPKS